MRDSCFGLRPHKLSRDKNFELIIQLLNIPRINIYKNWKDIRNEHDRMPKHSLHVIRPAKRTVFLFLVPTCKWTVFYTLNMTRRRNQYMAATVVH